MDKQICKTSIAGMQDLCALIPSEHTAKLLRRLEDDVNEQVVQTPLSECCYPAHSSHSIALLLYSSILLSLLSLRYCIFQSKCCRKEVQVPYNQIINRNVKTISRLTAMELCLPFTLSSFFLFNVSSANSILSSAYSNQEFLPPSLEADLEMLHFSMPVFNQMKDYLGTQETLSNIMNLPSKNKAFL